MPLSGESVQPYQRFEIELPARVPIFYLIEEAPVISDAAYGAGHCSPDTGLVAKTRRGLMFRTEIGQATVRLTVQLREDRAAIVAEDFDDVVECSFWSVTGEPAVLDWSKALVHPLATLPGGSGCYRVRYHVRAAAAGESRSNALVQLWPGEQDVEQRLKLTGRLGKFWYRDYGRPMEGTP